MTTLTKAQADLELTLLEAEADSMTSTDLFVWLHNIGLSPEIAGKLHDLIDKTKKIGERVIPIGKIILLKIIEFAKENPHLAIGAAVGAVVAVLLNEIPFLGALLAPIALALGLLAGYRLDKKEKGEDVASYLNIAAIAEDIIVIAKKFLDLLVEVFNVMFNDEQVGQ